jgi:hypothetical protein
MMKSRIIWALVWVNVALLVGTALKLTSPPASAQLRRPGNYIMIPGELVGGNNAAIYIVDTDNGRLSAVSFSDPTNQMSAMPPIDLNAFFQAAAAGAIRH